MAKPVQPIHVGFRNGLRKLRILRGNREGHDFHIVHRPDGNRRLHLFLRDPLRKRFHHIIHHFVRLHDLAPGIGVVIILNFSVFFTVKIDAVLGKYLILRRPGKRHRDEQIQPGRNGRSENSRSAEKPQPSERAEGKAFSVHALPPEFFVLHHSSSSCASCFIAVICFSSTPSVLSGRNRIFSVRSISLISSHTE